MEGRLLTRNTALPIAFKNIIARYLKMKSNKQRRAELKQRRFKRRESARTNPLGLGLKHGNALAADHSKLTHICAFNTLPQHYTDKPFICRDCGKSEVWSAKSQKWWYEEAQGHIDSTAVRCRACRDLRKKQKHEQQAHMQRVACRAPHPHAAFFNKKF